MYQDFSPLHCLIIFYCMDIWLSYIIHSLVDGHLGCFYFWLLRMKLLWTFMHRFFVFSFKDFIYLFLERWERREKERERNINVWLPLACPQLGMWPTTQACALTGNQTSDPLLFRLALNSLSHTSQSSCTSFCMNLYLQFPYTHEWNFGVMGNSLTFWETAHLFSKLAVQFYIPTILGVVLNRNWHTVKHKFSHCFLLCWTSCVLDRAVTWSFERPLNLRAGGTLC